MRRYIESLDGIRGLAILLVIFYHYSRLNGNDPSVLGFAWISIQMFFVQSGLLITEILLEDKNKPFKNYIGQFYWKRVLRIFPVYFAYLLIFTALYVIFNKPADFGQRAPYLFSFTYNFTRLLPDLNFNSVWFIHFWSLAVEEQFYLIWPLVIFFLNERGLKWLIAITLIVAPIFRYWLANHVLQMEYSAEMTGEITYAITLSQFDGFALGAAIPVFKLRERIRNPGRWALFVLLVVLVIGYLNYLSIKVENPSFSIASLGMSVGDLSNMQHVWSYSFINILFLFVILYIIKEGYAGVFCNRLLVKFGKIAYGMYIFHFAILVGILMLEQRFIHNHFVSILLALLICYGVAHVSYHYFEKKFLAFRNFWKSK